MIDFRKTVLGDLVRNVGKLRRGQILRSILKDELTQDFIIDLQQKQLRSGKDGRGELITPEYISPDYARAKQFIPGRIAPEGTPDLFLTGNFFDTIDVIIGQTFVEIIANTTIYGRDFKDIYGFDILGLNDESLQKLINFIKPEFIEEVKRRLWP